MTRQNQDEGDADVQTGADRYAYIFNRVREEGSARNEVDIQLSEVDPVTSNSQWNSSMEALCSCCAMAKKRKIHAYHRDVHGRPRESQSVQPARSIPRDVGDGEINDASCYTGVPGALNPARVVPRLPN